MAAPKLDSQLIIKKIDELPTLPAVVYELNRIINDPMSSTKEVEDIMAQDIGLTTKVLKLANSAYYSIPGGVTSLSRAIAFIGFDTVHQLVLSSSIIKALETKGPSEFDINEFWKHSIGVAIASEIIAKYVKHPSPTDLFTCGLIHDMGKIVLLVAMNEVLLYTSSAAKKNNLTFLEIEEKENQTPHTELGKLLAEKWLLPRSFLVAVKYHHEKDDSKRGPLSQDQHQVVDVVMLANLLLHALKFGNSGHSKIQGAPSEVLNRLTINPQKDLAPLIKQIKIRLEESSDFIKMIAAV